MTQKDRKNIERVTEMDIKKTKKTLKFHCFESESIFLTKKLWFLAQFFNIWVKVFRLGSNIISKSLNNTYLNIINIFNNFFHKKHHQIAKFGSICSIWLWKKVILSVLQTVKKSVLFTFYLFYFNTLYFNKPHKKIHKVKSCCCS